MNATGFNMLPPADHLCPICAVEHPAHEPHDAASLYYCMRFRATHGRHPTWADALAHCAEEVRTVWKEELQRFGAWSEPADGQPIADPPHDSFHRMVEVGEAPQTVPLPPGSGPEPETDA